MTWMRVSFASDCDDEGRCALCGEDYADCPCPGPTQDEEYEYEERPDGTLWARPKDTP